MTATHAHGTRASYQAGCRCLPCRCANATYRPTPRVDAAPARDHLQALALAGVGTRAVARLSGVPRSLICGIRSGAVRVLRAEVSALLLAVDRHDHAHTLPAGPTWVLVERLEIEGFTRPDIARRLGMADTRLRWGPRRRVRPGTEAKLRALLAHVTAEGE